MRDTSYVNQRAKFQIRFAAADRNSLKAEAAKRGVTTEQLIRDAALSYLPEQPGDHVVYIARCEDRALIKIGQTGDLEQRLRQLSVQTRSRMTLLAAFPGDRQTEKALLLHFRPYLVEGYEWFDANQMQPLVSQLDAEYAATLLRRPDYQPRENLSVSLDAELANKFERWGRQHGMSLQQACRQACIEWAGTNLTGPIVADTDPSVSTHEGIGLPRCPVCYYSLQTDLSVSDTDLSVSDTDLSVSDTDRSLSGQTPLTDVWGRDV